MLQADIQSRGGELAELRQYLASQPMWDPNLDPMTIRSDFYKVYYGPATGDALEYLDLTGGIGTAFKRKEYSRQAVDFRTRIWPRRRPPGAALFFTPSPHC